MAMEFTVEKGPIGGGGRSSGVASTPYKQVTHSDFTFEEVTAHDNKVVVSLIGEKGHGKTTMALGQEGEIYAFSFDDKTAPIKKGRYNNDKRIHVIDGKKYMVESVDQYRDSSAKCFDYIMWNLQEIAKAGGCDWIVVDGVKVFGSICEQKMRQEHGFEAFKAFGKENYGPWRERNMKVREFHRRALEIARKGIIYNMYYEYAEVEDKITGGVVSKLKWPGYAEVIMMESDILLFSKAMYIDGKWNYQFLSDSSKREDIVGSGVMLNVTNKIPQLWKQST